MKTYSIRIKHFRTGVWTHNSSITTSASVAEIKQDYEARYKQPVQVVEQSQQQIDRNMDAVRDSILGF